MKHLLTTLAIAATLVSCGKSDDSSAPKPPPKRSTALMAEDMDTGSSSKGANLCLKCNSRTDADTCPSCGETLKAKTTAPKTSHDPGVVGKTAVAPMWVCPKAKCDVSFPTEVKCAKHKDTLLVEQWYTCSKCSSEEPLPGKCGGCGMALKPTIER